MLHCIVVFVHLPAGAARQATSASARTQCLHHPVRMAPLQVSAETTCCCRHTNRCVTAWLANAQHTAGVVSVLLKMRCGCPVVGTDMCQSNAYIDVCRAHVHTLLTCAVAAVRGWLARRLRVKTIRAVLWLQRAARLFLQRQRAKTGEST